LPACGEVSAVEPLLKGHGHGRPLQVSARFRARALRDAVADFVKLRMWVFDAVPGSEHEFLAGYGSNPPASEEGRLR